MINSTNTHTFFNKKPSRLRLPLLLPLPLFFASCTHAPGILDYVSLPLPGNVQAKITGSQVEITGEFQQMSSAHKQARRCESAVAGGGDIGFEKAWHLIRNRFEKL